MTASRTRCRGRLGSTGWVMIGSMVMILAAADPPTQWLQENFPNPQTHPAACRAGGSRRLCDPDAVLSSDGLLKVETFLETKRYIPASSSSDDCLRAATSDHDTDGDGLEIQMAVALVNKMDLNPFGANREENVRQERAAETFARYVHDQWGVGVETKSCGGAGVLLFLSIADRTIYISRGSALENTLTNRRLDRVIDSMKDLLRSGKYDDAIVQALQSLQTHVEQGPPSRFEYILYAFLQILVPVLVFGIVIGFAIREFWLDSRRKREYAKAKSQLDEIDRAAAEALQGKYRCTSCPICLEDFPKPATEVEVVTIGSDGQPIKLLRCGHCMDETCWAEWVSSGRGTITKCPICMQDVGRDEATTNSTNTQHQEGGNANNNYNIRQDHNNNDEDRIVRQYRRERNFRLARLGNRYPEIVRQDMLQRWTQPTHGGALVCDPAFVQCNPALARPSSGNGGSRMTGGFGGSSSGGGRGGRW